MYVATRVIHEKLFCNEILISLSLYGVESWIESLSGSEGETDMIINHEDKILFIYIMDFRRRCMYNIHGREDIHILTSDNHISMYQDIWLLKCSSKRRYFLSLDVCRCGSIFHRIKSLTDHGFTATLSFRGQRKPDANSLIEFRLSKERSPHRFRSSVVLWIKSRARLRVT